MGLRLKILLGFLILTMMLFVAGVVSIYELNSIGTSVQELLDDNYKSINAAKIMLEALESEDSALLLLLLGKWEKGRSIMQSADSLFEHGFQIAHKNLTIPGEEAYLDSIRSGYNAFKNLWKRPIVGTQKERDLDWYFQDVHSSFIEVKSSVNNLMAINGQVMYHTASDLKQRSNRAIMPGIVAVISALVFTFIFNYFVNYFMVSPVVRITKGIKRFLEKKIPFNVEIETNDEFYDLASAIGTLCSRVDMPAEAEK